LPSFLSELFHSVGLLIVDPKGGGSKEGFPQ